MPPDGCDVSSARESTTRDREYDFQETAGTSPSPVAECDSTPLNPRNTRGHSTAAKRSNSLVTFSRKRSLERQTDQPCCLVASAFLRRIPVCGLWLPQALLIPVAAGSLCAGRAFSLRAVGLPARPRPARDGSKHRRVRLRLSSHIGVRDGSRVVGNHRRQRARRTVILSRYCRSSWSNPSRAHLHHR